MPILVDAPYSNVSSRISFVLQSSDGWAYAMRRDAAALSSTLQTFVKKMPFDALTVMPLPQISGKALGLAIDYLERKFDSGTCELSPPVILYQNLPDWEKQFLVTEALKDDVQFDGNGMLRALLFTAETLAIPSLIRLLELYVDDTVAAMMPNRSSVVEKFQLGDAVRFTPEEEALLFT